MSTHPHSGRSNHLDLLQRGYSRRGVLAGGAKMLGGAVLLGGASSWLAACGGDDSSSSGDSGDGSVDLGTIDYQLSWVKDYEFAGSYLADTHGYWTDQGLKVNLISGGGTTAPAQLIASGQAFVSTLQAYETALLKDSDELEFKVVGAVWQKFPLNILSRSSEPINTPQDLAGRKIGVFPANDTDWTAFLDLNGIDRSTITEVPVQYDITPLVNGEVDGYQGWGGGEQARLAAQGIDLTVLLMADFGYNPISAAYAVDAKTLDDEKKRAQLKAFLIGEIMGWQSVCFDNAVDEGAKLTVEKYGADLGEAFEDQKLALQAQVEYMVTPFTQEKGLMWMPDENIAVTQEIADRNELGVDMSSIITNEILEEIYAGKNRL